MTTKDLEQQLDLVIDRAPRLRQAGVLELAVGGLTITLAPAIAEPDKTDAKPDKTDETTDVEDIWEDKVLFPAASRSKKKEASR